MEETIKASYFKVFYFKRFANDLTTLMNCKTGNTTVVEYDVPYWLEQQVKHCYYFRNKYFFFFCEKYCEQFHLTKATGIFDGDLIQLEKFFQHIYKYRDEVFYYPRNNILFDSIVFEEAYLKDYLGGTVDMVIFIKPTKQQVMLDKYRTNIVYYGGINVFDSITNSTFPLRISSIGIFQSLLLGVFAWLTLI